MPQDDDAADRLAVEAFGQHHAVGEHLDLAAIEARDQVGAGSGGHLTRDRLGADVRAKRGSDRLSVLDGGAESDRAPVGGARLPVLDHGIVQDFVVEHCGGFGHIIVARGLVDRGEFVGDPEVDGVGSRRHQDALLDQVGDRHLEANVAESSAQATSVARSGVALRPRSLMPFQGERAWPMVA
jgi:hypothetical protein